MAKQDSLFTQQGTANCWQDWTNLLLAMWLFVSPWALGLAFASVPAGSASAAKAGLVAAAWNAWIFGVVVALIAGAALFQVRQWEEWTNLVIGIWVAISPWVLSFSGASAAA